MPLPNVPVPKVESPEAPMGTAAPAALDAGQVSSEPIRSIAQGFMAAKLLFVSYEVGLFHALGNGPAALDELARLTGVPPRTLRILADAMVGLSLLGCMDDGRYRNAPVAARFLAGEAEDDIGPLLRFWNRLSYPGWQHLEASVRADQPAPRSGQHSAADQQIISEGIEAATWGAARALAELYVFAPHRRVLDAGGGTGSFLLPILERFPHVEGTLFDLAPVAFVASERLARRACGGRVRVVAGDFMVDPLPTDHDLVLLANVVHLFTPERNRALLSRVRRAVSPGARLLVTDLWTDPTHTEPLGAALRAGEYLLVAGGDVYSVDEGRVWLEATGWRPVDHAPLVYGWSVVIAEAR